MFLKCAKEVTMKKHTNTKHSKTMFACEVCKDIFECKNIFEIHKQEVHQDDHAFKITDYQDIQNSDTDIPECSLCNDTHNSNVEYTEHINIDLIEIQDINIDDLKKGHENFECNLYVFSSSDSESAKKHLREYTLKPKAYNHRKKNISKEGIRAVLQTVSLLDLYKNDYNPLYSTGSKGSDTE